MAPLPASVFQARLELCEAAISKKARLRACRVRKRLDRNEKGPHLFAMMNGCERDQWVSCDSAFAAHAGSGPHRHPPASEPIGDGQV